MILPCAILAIVVLYLAIQGLRCHLATKQACERLETYNVHTAELSYGNMNYVDEGEGEVILSVHGIFGGYDQAFETCRDFAADHRIIAPSRFGYLGSDILGTGTPAEQAAAYAQLLDTLGIDKVFVLATSAGGSVALRFALDYPEKTKGLILYCSAMPYPEKPEKYASYAGPPAFMCSDYAMFLLSPLFEPIMGMESSTIYSMLPIGERKEGVILDSAVTNPDMARNYDEYQVEDLKCPVMILHAKDDKLASYTAVTNVLDRFTSLTKFVSFETGGHLMAGHGEKIRKVVEDFISENI